MLIINILTGVNFDPLLSIRCWFNFLSFFTEVAHLDRTSGEIFVLFLPIVFTKLDCLGTV